MSEHNLKHGQQTIVLIMIRIIPHKKQILREEKKKRKKEKY